MDMINNVIASYKNGNTQVTILSDGTKIREFEETPEIEFMESIDVKITNYCDLNCPFCHEQSSVNGKHADIDKLIQLLDDANLPRGIELSIGGGKRLPV